MNTETEIEDSTKLKEELLEIYPAKVTRKRSKHIVVNDPKEIPEIQANIRTVPGIITQRGCCFAGCKGVVMGPIIDMVHIVHGPVGCAFYSWGTRRNLGKKEKNGMNFLQYCFSTDMQESEIIFGGEKKLRNAIKEAYNIFKPKAIGIYATCPVGLIGDDINSIAREMKEELGINIFAFSCEGYKGVSQSAGHHIANNGLFTNVVGLDDDTNNDNKNKYTINILGEYNIGGDTWEIERVLNLCNIDVVATLSGDVKYDEIAKSHNANLNTLMCHRSINYMAEMMETKFGIPWLKVNFIGAKATAKSIRKIAQYFGDKKLIEKVDDVIEKELAEVEKVQNEVRKRCENKTTMLFVGGSRAHHYQELFKEIGMKIVTAGYEFAHRDDYEGRRVIPKIKIDADSRNIEELEVKADAGKYKARKTKEEIDIYLRKATKGDYDNLLYRSVDMLDELNNL